MQKIISIIMWLLVVQLTLFSIHAIVVYGYHSIYGEYTDKDMWVIVKVLSYKVE